MKATWPRENGKQVPSVIGIALDDDLPFEAGNDHRTITAKGDLPSSRSVARRPRGCAVASVRVLCGSVWVPVMAPGG